MELDPKTAAGIVYGLCYAGGVVAFVYSGLTEGMMRDRRGFATVVVVSLLWPLALALAGLATMFLWWEDHKKACGKAKGQVAPDASADKKVGEDNKERIHGDGHAGEQAGRGKVRLRLEQPCPPGMEEYGADPDLVYARVVRQGWDVEKALTTPKRRVSR